MLGYELDFCKIEKTLIRWDSRLLAVPFYLFVDSAVDEGGCTFAMISRVFFVSDE